MCDTRIKTEPKVISMECFLWTQPLAVLSLFMYIAFLIQIGKIFISGNKEKVQDSKIYISSFVK